MPTPGAATGSSDIPDGAMCWYLIASLGALGVAGGAALAMRWAQMEPLSRLLASAYGSLYFIHTAFMVFGALVPVAFVLLPWMVSRRALPTWWRLEQPLGYASLGVWLVGMLVIISIVVRPDASNRAALPTIAGTAALAVIIVVALLLLVLLRHRAPASGVASLAAMGSLVVSAGWSEMVAQRLIGSLAGDVPLPASMTPVMAAFGFPTSRWAVVAVGSILPYLLEQLGARRRSLWFPAAMLGLIALPLLRASELTGLAALAGMVGFCAAVARMLVGTPRRSSAAWLAVALGILPGLLLYALVEALREGWSIDIHLGDATVVAASGHLAGSVALSTLFLARAALSRPPSPLLGRLGTCLWSLGFLGVGVLFCVNGIRGMPRSYFRYLDTFRSLQRILGGFAVLAAAGASLAILSFLVPRRPAGGSLSACPTTSSSSGPASPG
jgi:hypothetical protein